MERGPLHTAGATAPDAPRVRLSRLVLPCILLGVAAALRLGPATESIWYDEWCRTRQWLNADNLGRILWRDVHNPLYNAFMYLWTALFGDSEASIRLPSLAMGIGSAWTFGVWAGRRFGRPVGFTVTLWLLTSPVHIWWSAEAKNVIFVSAWAMLAIVAYDELARRPDRRRWIIATLVGIAGVWTDFVVLAAIVPAAAFAMRKPALPDEPDPRRRVAASFLAVLLAAVPLAVVKLSRSSDLLRTYLAPFQFDDLATLIIAHYPCGEAIFPEEPQRGYLLLALAFPVVATLVLGLLRGVRSPSGRAAAAVLLLVPLGFLLATPVIEAMWDDGLHYVYQKRNTIVMLGPFALVLSLGCWSLPRRRGRVIATGLFITLNVVAATLMQTLHADRFTVMAPTADYDKLAAMIAADASKAGTTDRPHVFAKAHPQPLSYYEPRLTTSTTWGSGLAAAPICDRLAKGLPVYVMNDLTLAPLAPGERAMLRSIGNVRAVGVVGWIEVLRLDARARPSAAVPTP